MNDKTTTKQGKPLHLYVMDKVPGYKTNTPKTDIRAIKECLHEFEIDDHIINNLTADFCMGFGIARDIIIELLRQEYWKNNQL